MTQKEPVAIAGLATMVVSTFVLFAIQAGWIVWDSEQLASFNNLVAAIAALAVVAVPLVGAYLARRKVTPIANPKNADGVELVAKVE